MNAEQTIQTLIARIAGWLSILIGFAFLILMAAAILAQFGFNIPLRAPAATEFAYLAGAWWLIRK